MVGIKNNRRTQFTIDRIKKTFLALLETKELSQITVTEICKIADINRGTFYIHYRDPYQLFDAMQQEFNRDLLETLREDQSLCTVEESLIKLLHIIREKKAIFSTMRKKNGGQNFLSEVLFDTHADYLRRTGNERSDKAPDSMDYSFTYMVHGSMGIINQWLEANGPESPQDLAHIISSLTQSNVPGSRNPVQL